MSRRINLDPPEVDGPGFPSQTPLGTLPPMAATPAPIAKVAAASPRVRYLPTTLILRVLELLPPNDLACHGRAAFREAAQHFSAPQHTTVCLSLPLSSPHTAHAWQQHAQASLKHLPFHRKLRLLTTAASSGSDTNMEVAWALVKPGLFPDPLGAHYARAGVLHTGINPGAAAARSPEPIKLLTWLLQHGCPVNPFRTFCDVARHCPLGVLQQTVDLMRSHRRKMGGGMMSAALDGVLQAAAASDTPDVLDKLAFILQEGRSGLRKEVAEAAVRAGDLARVKWLHERGCPFADRRLLVVGLEHAPLEVVQWLLDEGGCTLPGVQGGGRQAAAWGDAAAREQRQEEEQQGEVEVEMEEEQEEEEDGGSEVDSEVGDLEVAAGGGGWASVCRGAGASGWVDTLRWLQLRSGGRRLHGAAIEGAAGSGSLEAVRFLHEECGQRLSEEVFGLAAGSGCMALLEWLRGRGCPMGPWAYAAAAQRGELGTMRWLVDQAKCPLWENEGCSQVADVVRGWGASASGGGMSAASDEDCQAACRLLLQAGCVVRGSSLVLVAAARRGQAELVQMLYDDAGCVFSREVLFEAARSGCEALLEWLVGAGCVPGEAPEDDPWVAAAENADLATLVCLKRLGVRWGSNTLREAVCRGVALQVLRWLVEHGAAGEEGAVERARSGAREVGCGEEVEEWLSGLQGR